MNEPDVSYTYTTAPEEIPLSDVKNRKVTVIMQIEVDLHRSYPVNYLFIDIGELKDKAQEFGDVVGLTVEGLPAVIDLKD